jgi:plastocyanin
MNRRQLLTLSLLAAGAACAPSIAAAEEHIVEMNGLEFSPAELVIRVGDTVTWVNLDVMAHTTTSADGSWDSGSMTKGDEWSFTFDDAGVFAYDCTFHPTMRGMVVVE